MMRIINILNNSLFADFKVRSSFHFNVNMEFADADDKLI